MLTFDKKTKEQLIYLSENKNIYLEGNIIKIVDTEGDEELKKYLDDCLKKDKENRKKRLEITKKVQEQNKELVKLNEENELIMTELRESLQDIEESKTQIEKQNLELIQWKDENERIGLELKEQMLKVETARIEAENSKKIAESDLDLLQRKIQSELIGKIVKVSLAIIIGVGISSTLLFIFSILTNKDTQLIGSTWSNLLGILLTNAFSIIGTIMGVKYATEKRETF